MAQDIDIFSTAKKMLLGSDTQESLSDETKERLLGIKKDIVKEYINSLKKNNPKMSEDIETLEKYLINDGKALDAFWDIFRGCLFAIKYPALVDNIDQVKKRLSTIENIPTSEELSKLKSDILAISNQLSSSSTTQTQRTQSQQTTSSSGSTESSREISEQQNKFVEAVYKRAAQLVGTRYKFGGKSPKTGIDCSGLWQRAFTQEGIKFSGWFNAHAFSDADVDVTKEQVRPGDFMFWDQKPGTKKHNSIYHIEMVVSKPYTKNGKTYVRTLGSSTDAKDDLGNRVGNGVQFREREMKAYRHYGRPTYFYQMAQYEKTGSSSQLVASRNKPSQDLQSKVMPS